MDRSKLFGGGLGQSIGSVPITTAGGGGPISTHIMQMEHYPDYDSFCGTASYQQWLETWRRPTPTPAVDLWVDHHGQPWLDGKAIQTPRQEALIRVATRLPFYLLATLEIGDLPCVDIGCGLNWFRQFYPSIWGVDPHNEPHRDEPLTPEWWIPNWGRWPRAFSCNAMHFCDQATIAQNIGKVRGILAPGGCAVITLNRARIQDRTQHYSEDRLREDLETTPGLTRMVWMDTPHDAHMDGNVWLWIDAE
jgi:hypothetical protein